MGAEDSTEEVEDVLLNQLTKEDWNAVGRMTEQVEADQKFALELVGRMGELQAKPEEGRTNEELMQDREVLESAKRQLRILDARTYNRNKLRKAGMALELYKIRCELREAEAVRSWDNPEGEVVGNEEESDGFWRISPLGVWQIDKGET